MDFMGLSTSFHSEKSFPSVCSVFPAVKHVFYSVFLVHVVVFVCPCVGVGPEKSWQNVWCLR